MPAAMHLSMHFMRTPLEQLACADGPEELDQRGDESRPPGLMAGTEPRAVVAVEVLVEEQMVAPVRVGLELLGTAEHRTAAPFVPEKDARQPCGNLPGDFEEIHHDAGPGGALDREAVAVVRVELQERADQQRVHRHPDWSAPVRISAKHRRVRLRWQIAHPVLLSAGAEYVRVVEVHTRERPDAEGAEEFVLVEHPREDAAQPLAADEREDTASAVPEVSLTGRMDAVEQLRL